MLAPGLKQFAPGLKIVWLQVSKIIQNWLRFLKKIYAYRTYRPVEGSFPKNPFITRFRNVLAPGLKIACSRSEKKLLLLWKLFGSRFQKLYKTGSSFRKKFKPGAKNSETWSQKILNQDPSIFKPGAKKFSNLKLNIFQMANFLFWTWNEQFWNLEQKNQPIEAHFD